MVTKLTLEYDGTAFAGWSRQPDLRTVQEELERALRTILGEHGHDGEPLTVTVAGRTDRGVHAWGQVVSYRHEAVDPMRLNSLLPKDMAVRSAEPAPEGFDARRDAISRTYCYRVLTRRTRGVFTRSNALWWPRETSLQSLQLCARALEGVHDFTAFTPTETEHVRFERNVLDARWVQRGNGQGEGKGDSEGAGEQGELLEFWITARSFLRHMNRVLVGTMLEVAVGRRTLEEFVGLLEGRPRAEAGPTVPAHGLALVSVAY